MNVRDTELTVPSGKGYIHTKTKRPISRLADGRQHPVRSCFTCAHSEDCLSWQQGNYIPCNAWESDSAKA